MYAEVGMFRHPATSVSARSGSCSHQGIVAQAERVWNSLNAKSITSDLARENLRTHRRRDDSTPRERPGDEVSMVRASASMSVGLTYTAYFSTSVAAPYDIDHRSPSM